MHSILFFSEDEGRMGSGESYFLAINENEVLTAPYIEHSVVEKIKLELRKKAPSKNVFHQLLKKIKFKKEDSSKSVFQQLINEVEFFPPNNKGGWDFDMFPIIRLMHSVYPEGTPFDDEVCLEYKKEYFKLNTFVNAGMGNMGVCLGQFEVIKKKNMD